MNTPDQAAPSVRALAVRFALPALLLSASFVPVPAKSATTPPETKTHTLFMGADIAVEQNKQFFRVHDVFGGSFVIKVRKERVLIPMTNGAVNLRVDSALKLTEASATVSNLKADRAYTQENDPYKKFAREQPGGAGAAQTQLAAGQLYAAQTSQSQAQLAARGASGPGIGMAQGGVDAARASVSSASTNFDSAALASRSDFNNVGQYAGKLQQELDKKLFDAMQLDFEVSSEKPLNEPYVVVIATYHEQGASPDQHKNWIYAEALDPVGRTPRTVHILRGGFPPGFEMTSYELHLYNKGEELATNVAPKRVALTRDEAFQYMLLEYVSDNKNATLPAVPAMGQLPADLPARLAQGQFAQTFYVKVSKDGQAIDAYVDESCSQKADDPYVVSLLKGICFKPALEKGRPVEGISRLKLSELSL